MNRRYLSRNGFRLLALEFETPHAQRIGMPRSEERSLVTEIEDRLIDFMCSRTRRGRRKIGTERVSCKSRFRPERGGKRSAADA